MTIRPTHCRRITANSNVYFSKIQPLLQSFSGNESNRSPWVEEIAFPELHFTAWCWIHSSGNSFWMFHHRVDPRGWYNPLITRTHTYTHAQTRADAHVRIMHVGDMRVNHLLGERFDCIFNVGGYKHDRMSSQAATVALICQKIFGGAKLSLLIFLCWRGQNPLFMRPRKRFDLQLTLMVIHHRTKRSNVWTNSPF